MHSLIWEDSLSKLNEGRKNLSLEEVAIQRPTLASVILIAGNAT